MWKAPPKTFQTLIGTVKSTLEVIAPARAKAFQTLIGTVKSRVLHALKGRKEEFQTLIGTVKRRGTNRGLWLAFSRFKPS